MTMAKPGLGARLRYAFDKSMAGGPIALIGWLALVSLAIIIVAGLILAPPRSRPTAATDELRRGLLAVADARRWIRARSPATMAGRSGSSCCS